MVVSLVAELGKKKMKKKNIHARIFPKIKKMIKVPKWALTPWVKLYRFWAEKNFKGENITSSIDTSSTELQIGYFHVCFFFHEDRPKKAHVQGAQNGKIWSWNMLRLCRHLRYCAIFLLTKDRWNLNCLCAFVLFLNSGLTS